MNGKEAIKAYRYEMTEPKYRNENGNNVPDGTETKTCFLATGYEKDEVDYGNYWDVSEGCFYLSDEKGNYILEDGCTIHDWYSIGYVEKDVSSLVRDLANPYDFFEVKYGKNKENTLRVTALPERPRVCAEKCDRGDVSYRALRRIRIYGKPVQDDGILTRTNNLWIDDLKDKVLESIREKCVTEEGVEINWNGDGILCGCEGELSFSLNVIAPSVDALKRVLVNLGAKKIDDARIKTNLVTGNEASGERRVHANITVSSEC